MSLSSSCCSCLRAPLILCSCNSSQPSLLQRHSFVIRRPRCTSGAGGSLGPCRACRNESAGINQNELPAEPACSAWRRRGSRRQTTRPKTTTTTCAESSRLVSSPLLSFPSLQSHSISSHLISSGLNSSARLAGARALNTQPPAQNHSRHSGEMRKSSRAISMIRSSR